MFRRVSTWDQQPQEWADIDWGGVGAGLATASNFGAGPIGIAQGWAPSGSGASFVAAPGGVGASANGSGGFNATNPITIAPGASTSFAVMLTFRLNATGQGPSYALFQLQGAGQTAIIYGYVAGTFELYTDGHTGSNPRGSSGIQINDLNTHTLIYSYDGTVFSGYLDGQRVFSTPLTFALPASAPSDGRLLRSNVADYLRATVFGHATFGRGLSDAAARSLSANPWALFQRREWVFSNVAAGGGGGNVTVSISGLGASALAGNLAPSLSASISGAAASLAAGNVGVSRSVAASGVSATGQVGSLKAALSVALSGLQATGGIGTVTAQIAGNVTVSISGVSATVQAGTVVPALAISVTGLSSTSAVGSVTRSQSVGITGIQSAAQAGTVTTTGGVEQVKSKGLRKTRYTPGRVPSDAKELARFIQNELERLTDALESPFTHQLLEVLHAEPSRKSGEAAMVAYADGTDWNPGAGRGLYLYDPQTAAWTKL